MFSRVVFRGLLFFAASALPLSAISAQMAPQFQTEAPKGWQRYLEFARALQGSIERRSYDTDKAKVLFPGGFKLVIKQASGMCLWDVNTTDGDGKSRHVVRAVNTQYWFELRRKPGDDWRIDQLSLDLKKPENKKASAAILEEVAGALCLNLQLERTDFWLPTWGRSKDFVVKSSQIDVKTGFARVEFRHDTNKKGWGGLLIRSGTLTLDPAKCWVLKGFEATWDDPGGTKGDMTGVYEYDNEASEFPIVRRHVLALRSTERPAKKPNYSREYVYDCNLRTAESAPEAEFMLSNFGLPEPAGIDAPGMRNWFIWVIAVGIFALVGGLFLRRFTRRPTTKL